MCSVKTVRFNLIPISFASTTGKSLSNPAAAALHRCNIASVSMSEQQIISSDPSDVLINYPVPLSPPLPAISKAIEQARAISASARSSSFSRERHLVIFEDEWLIAVNKPHGIYCESVLASAAQLGEEGITETPVVMLSRFRAWKMEMYWYSINWLWIELNFIWIAQYAVKSRANLDLIFISILFSGSKNQRQEVHYEIRLLD